MSLSKTTLSRIKDVTVAVEEVYPLDEIDIALLKSLTSDARTSQRQLAVALGISAPTVSERMSRLERAGVITGYTAQINWPAVGFSQAVYLSVSAVVGHDLADIMQRLWGLPEVQEVTLITGNVDILVRLRVKDHAHLKELLMEHIWQITGIQGTETQISIAEMPTKNIASGLLQSLEEQLERQRSNNLIKTPQ